MFCESFNAYLKSIEGDKEMPNLIKYEATLDAKQGDLVLCDGCDGYKECFGNLD